MSHSALCHAMLAAKHPKDEADAIASHLPYRASVGRGDASKPLADRLLARLAFGHSSCWHWRGRRNRFGYGRMSYRGTETMAHRLSYEAFVGPIAEGMSVLHRCDNPSCINPEHLWLGTYSDNRRDAQTKGRWVMKNKRAGFTHQTAKITPKMLIEIREMRKLGMSYARIGKALNVSAMAVWHADHGRFE